MISDCVLGRRSLLASLALGLTGCGFHPVYAPETAGLGPTGVQGELAQVQVGLIPERSGQLLRQALQRRIDRGEGFRKRYELAVNYSLTIESTGYQIDASVTRQRVQGVGNWQLKALDTGATISTGTARSLDGLDVLDQQYFAADVASETVQRRLAENLADLITLQVAAYLARNPTLG